MSGPLTVTLTEEERKMVGDALLFALTVGGSRNGLADMLVDLYLKKFNGDQVRLCCALGMVAK